MSTFCIQRLGLKAAKDLSLPDDFLVLGQCERWSAAECAENLAKMAAFTTLGSPIKRRKK